MLRFILTSIAVATIIFVTVLVFGSSLFSVIGAALLTGLVVYTIEKLFSSR